MNLRERLLLALCGKTTERIPWVVRAPRLLMPLGSVEREVRNNGCTLLMREEPYLIERPHVAVKETQKWHNGRLTLTRVYETPLGNVSERTVRGGAYLNSHDLLVERVVKRPSDYQIVKFIVEDTVYHASYNKITQMQEFLGTDGVLMALVEYSPFEKLLFELMGVERLSLDLYDHPGLVHELLSCIEKKQNEMYQVVGDAPVEIVESKSNVTSELISPTWFEKYCLTAYNRQAAILHGKGKCYMVHMDGKLKALAHLVARTDIDIIDSFNPPPMGDLSLKAARQMWRDKVIMVNFPASICWQGEVPIQRFFHELLAEAFPGDRFVLGIMEDIPQKIWAKSLKVLTMAMTTYGTYPLQL